MRSKRKISALLVVAALMMGLSACGETEPEEKYVSPTFNTEVVTKEKNTKKGKGDKTTEEAEKNGDVEDSGLSKGDPVKASDLETPPSTETTIAGSYENGSYYNPFVGLAIRGEGLWRLYDAKAVAEATGLTEDEVNDLWYGVVSPYSVKTMTCAIAYKSDTGSNLIVSYINPKLYYMKSMTAHEYLELSVRDMKDVEVKNVNYLGQVYAMTEIPGATEQEGTRVQFAIRKDDLIVLLTYTLVGEDTLEEAADHVTELIMK